eukprot:12781725-Heterocapsa_arctica.AAC.1
MENRRPLCAVGFCLGLTRRSDQYFPTQVCGGELRAPGAPPSSPLLLHEVIFSMRTCLWAVEVPLHFLLSLLVFLVPNRSFVLDVFHDVEEHLQETFD